MCRRPESSSRRTYETCCACDERISRSCDAVSNEPMFIVSLDRGEPLPLCDDADEYGEGGTVGSLRVTADRLLWRCERKSALGECERRRFLESRYAASSEDCEDEGDREARRMGYGDARYEDAGGEGKE